MATDTLAESVRYEQLTKAVYEEILKRDGGGNILVEHNTQVLGRSGVLHQIDVFWKFHQAGIEHCVLVECKNYNSTITLEKVRNIFAVAHDIGNCRAVMVTKTGYQSGAAEFSRYYGIGLKLLKQPEEADWKGRIQKIVVDVTVKFLSSDPERAVCWRLALSGQDEAQQKRLENLQARGEIDLGPIPDMQFRDVIGFAVSEEMRRWLPRNLDILSKEPGGPYVQKIPLTDHYVLVNFGKNTQEIFKALGLTATYYVESLSEQVINDASLAVNFILKDFNTGEIEHFHRTS